MSREILFRGQRVDTKEWVEGDLLQEPDNTTQKETLDGNWVAVPDPKTGIFSREDRRWFDVHPETVSFASSRKDENGKRIFHGDKVEFTVFDCFDNDTQYTGVVVFTGDKFIIQKGIEDPYYGSDGPFDLDEVCEQDDTIKVIGNIWEEK